MAFKIVVAGVPVNFQQDQATGTTTATLVVGASRTKILQEGFDMPTNETHPYVRMTFERITKEEYEAAK